MMTDFALSLSLEGIELLHRSQSGWRRLGGTSIDSTTLDADLAELCQKAIALAPAGLTTKLIIPREQIKYTAIDSAMTTDADVRAVLDGATPYALDDLVIDSERFGGRTHIAAVSRDTLQEAEAFASAHGFRPVAFVAVPEPFTFQSEVFFGPTEAMPAILGASATVTRDTLPVIIVGTRIKSRLLVMDHSLVFQDADQLADMMAQNQAQNQAQVAPEAAQDDIPPRGLASRSFRIDMIPPEHYLVSPATAIAEPPVPVIAAHPVFADWLLRDAIIPEYHPAAVVAATAKPVVTLSAPRRTQTATPVKRTNPVLIAASIAAFVAVLGGVIWSQLPAPEITVAPEIATAPIAVTTSAPTPAEPVLDDGPVLVSVEITGFAAAPESVQPQIVSGSQTPVPVAPPVALSAPAADALPVAVQAPPAPPVSVQVGTVGTVLSPDEAARIYAATGVWQRAPRLLDEPSGAFVLGFDRPALTTAPAGNSLPVAPFSTATTREQPFDAPADPPPPDAVFERDDDGFILATPEGTVTPEGAVVFAGLPDLTVTPRLPLSEADLSRNALLAPPPEGVNLIIGRPAFETPLRPADLDVPATSVVTASASPVATAGSVGLASLELQSSGTIALDTAAIENRAADDLRPQLRPNGLVATADAAGPDITDILEGIESEDATLRFVTSTALAVPASLRPQGRPSGFADLVAAAQDSDLASRIEEVAAAVAPVAPVTPAAPVAPQNAAPVPGGVARAATLEDVIRLREINLIGVYGRPNARRALVRLGNGSYVRVEVGSALDGGQVTAIGDEALNYVKRGLTYAVEMPSG